MNHYQRLKIAPDAPVEVIRAAYRALASKLHPDRQPGEIGPDSEVHGQMAALNNAYEVLIDPELREAYDAMLTPNLADDSVFSEEDSRPFSDSVRPDRAWRAPTAAPARKAWPLKGRAALFGSIGVGAIVVGVGMWAWHMASQTQVDKALSDQFNPNRGAIVPTPEPARAEAEAPPALPAAEPSTLAHKPTVEELARMSDEELLKALPKLDANAPTAQAKRGVASLNTSRRHLLDGQALALRIETRLVDPLAPEPLTASTPVKRP